MALSDDEKKQLEDLQRKEKEPSESGPRLVINIGGEGGMSIDEAVKRGYLTELEAEKLEEEEDDEKDGKKKKKTKKKDDDEEEAPARRGYFNE